MPQGGGRVARGAAVDGHHAPETSAHPRICDDIYRENDPSEATESKLSVNPFDMI